MNQYKIDFNSIDWDTPMVGVHQKVVEQNGKQFRLLEFSKEFVEVDWCIKGHTGYILDGQLEIDFHDKTIG